MDSYDIFPGPGAHAGVQVPYLTPPVYEPPPPPPHDAMSAGVAKLRELRACVDDISGDATKFYDKGNKAAGVRARKKLQNLKALAQELRVGIQKVKAELSGLEGGLEGDGQGMMGIGMGVQEQGQGQDGRGEDGQILQGEQYQAQGEQYQGQVQVQVHRQGDGREGVPTEQVSEAPAGEAVVQEEAQGRGEEQSSPAYASPEQQDYTAASAEYSPSSQTYQPEAPPAEG